MRGILEAKFPNIEFSLVDGEKNNYLTRDATIHICLFDLGKLPTLDYCLQELMIYADWPMHTVVVGTRSDVKTASEDIKHRVGLSGLEFIQANLLNSADAGIAQLEKFIEQHQNV